MLTNTLILPVLCLTFLFRSANAAKTNILSRSMVLKRLGGNVVEDRLYFDRCRQTSVYESCIFAMDESINQEPWSNECAATSADMRPWWEGRLENPSYITRVIFYTLTEINDRGLDALLDFELLAGSHVCVKYRSFMGFLNKTFTCDTFSDYVRIQSNLDHAVLALCEVEVYGKAVKFMRNIEPYSNGHTPLSISSCIASSVHSNSGLYLGCHFAIDNNLDQSMENGHCALTQAEAAAYYEFRLRDPALIRYAIVWNRKDCCQEQLNNFYLSVDGQLCARHDHIRPFSNVNVTCGRFGQAVRLTTGKSKGENQFPLCEIQLYGYAIEYMPQKNSKYLGCYREKKHRRDMERMVGMSRMSPDKCARICHRRKKPFFGLQQGKQCWCSERYGRYGMAAEESSCWMPCVAEMSRMCGAKLFNSVYELNIGSADSD